MRWACQGVTFSQSQTRIPLDWFRTSSYGREAFEQYALPGGMSSFHWIKREVLQTDWSACITEASHHNSTSLASQIASDTSWMKLGYGPQSGTSRYYLSLPETDQTAVQVRYLSPLWILYRCPLFPSLHFLSHTSQWPRACHQVSFMVVRKFL